MGYVIVGVSGMRHRNPMRTHCQFTFKRPEKRVDLTVAAEQNPRGVQVVEWVGLVISRLPVIQLSCLIAWYIN
ncbi:MAG: hypothetical protein VYC47_05585, partial [Verrucomicrobiota bacterium]|nr:hypothetical protein [Verrucomicrobiota bacterium]